jgi:hypothetical protein
MAPVFWGKGGVFLGPRKRRKVVDGEILGE